jgi:glycosyltransferase involved in cell wall biosynthesis
LGFLMKICLFLPSFLPNVGGLEKTADTLASILSERGHEPVILAQISRGGSEAVRRPYPVHFYRRSRSASLLPVGPLTALSLCHRRYRFDLLWAYEAYPQGYIAVRVGLWHSIPVVISSRGGDLSRRGRYLARWLPRRRIIWALRQADAVTTLNRHLTQRVEDLTGGSIRARLIFNGVDAPQHDATGEPPPKPFQDLQGRPFMLALARLHKFKGIDLIIEAIRLRKKRRHATPLLVVAGSGRQYGALRRQVARGGLRREVVFAGEVSGRDKTWLLANCAFLVQPSREGEGMPNSVLEAMSYGKPVLGTASPGIEEILCNQVNGVLVPPNDPVELAQGLEQMLAADLARWGAAARKTALDNSQETCAGRYLDLFEEVIDARRYGTGLVSARSRCTPSGGTEPARS